MQDYGYQDRRWLNTAILYLFIVALLGLLLRFMAAESIAGFNFKHILHAHSHTALLGWVYAALYIAFLQSFLPVKIASAKKYKWLFWLTQLAVLGMLCSFPFQGYKAVSITFSTLHILCTYAFVFYFLRDLKQTDLYSAKVVSVSFIKASLFFLVISSFGPFSLGPIMVNGYTGSNIYYLAVYYYLHFQYNGWFTFAIFAILFRWWRKSGFQFSKKRGRQFFRLMFWSCLPAYALSALWTKPGAWVYIVGGAAAVIQVAALIYFSVSFFYISKQQKILLPKISQALFVLCFLAFSAKLVMQLFSALPVIANLTYLVREFVIGYLHLVLIGFVSFFLLAYFIAQKELHTDNFLATNGLIVFIGAFIITELLIFLQGFLYWQFSYALPNYTMLLFLASIFLPLGIGMFLYGQFYRKNSHI
ncbi:MAG: hypothetical protein ACXWW0_05655 [Bacteroidia bacterium]